MGTVILRTHGGLGNQLFQILYGRLFAEAQHCGLRELHDQRYEHKFDRAAVPSPAPAPSNWQRAVSAARIPKVLQRVVGRAETPWRCAGDWYLDGYFQTDFQYRAFEDGAVHRELCRLASELGIGPSQDETCLVHLRVGDFFGDNEAALRHVTTRLRTIPAGAHVITNDEALLEDPEARALLDARQGRLITTADFSAEDVLRTLARYRVVDANDSTLTVWAHVLAGTQVDFQNLRLSALAAHLGLLGPGR